VVRQAHQPAQHDDFLLVQTLWFDKLTNQLRVTELWGDGMNQGCHPGLDPGSVEYGMLAYTDPVVRQAHQPAQHDDFLLV